MACERPPKLERSGKPAYHLLHFAFVLRRDKRYKSTNETRRLLFVLAETVQHRTRERPRGSVLLALRGMLTGTVKKLLPLDLNFCACLPNPAFYRLFHVRSSPRCVASVACQVDHETQNREGQKKVRRERGRLFSGAHMVYNLLRVQAQAPSRVFSSVKLPQD